MWHQDGDRAAAAALRSGGGVGALGLLWILCALPAAIASPLLGATPPSRLHLLVPRDPLLPGQAASLTIETVGERGERLAATRQIEIFLAGATALTGTARVTLQPGQTATEVSIRPPSPGVWMLEVSSPGLSSATDHVVCVDAKTLDSHRAVRARPEPRVSAAPLPVQVPRSASAMRFRATPMPMPPPPAGGGGGGSGAGGSSSGAAAPEGAGGEVRLLPDHSHQRRGAAGWDGVNLGAYWYEQGKPAAASRPIDLILVAQRGELKVEPQRLRIPSGDFEARPHAVASANVVGTAVVQALYPGGQSNPVEIEFLAPAPVRLAFEGGQELVGGRAQVTIRGFGVVSSQLWVRLLDASGQPVVAEQPVPVTVEVVDPTGASKSLPTSPLASVNDPPVPIELSRWGTYTVRASAPGLADAVPLSIQFAIDWLLIAVALLGGIAGSLARVLSTRPGNWRSGLLRVVALGSLAALIILLLASFGLLSLLGSTPAELQKIPLKSLAGVFLLGFLGGFLFDLVLGRLRNLGAGPPAPAAT
jgi:hypothetical protein